MENLGLSMGEFEYLRTPRQLGGVERPEVRLISDPRLLSPELFEEIVYRVNMANGGWVYDYTSSLDELEAIWGVTEGLRVAPSGYYLILPSTPSRPIFAGSEYYDNLARIHSQIMSRMIKPKPKIEKKEVYVSMDEYIPQIKNILDNMTSNNKRRAK
jgi:hypothetical protein